MFDLVYCEFAKLKHSNMLLISFLGAFVAPSMMFIEAIRIHASQPERAFGIGDMYSSCLLYSMLLFGTVVYVVIGSYLFSREYTENTLKSILTIPVSKSSFLISKFIMFLIWIQVLTLITWASMLMFAAIFIAMYHSMTLDWMVAMQYLGSMLLGGLLLFITLSPFIFVTLWTKQVVIPVIAATAIVMGNAALANESLGALFPWTATFLLVSDRLVDTGYSIGLSMGLIILVSAVGFGLSAWYFANEDVK
ncbi:MAG: ABC transporter permease [Anaerolineaceae bacterium]|nr:ABC transporter permease [Anaerolineaceae bacterium]